MAEKIATTKFTGQADSIDLRAGFILETDAGLEKVVFNNNSLLRTLSRQSDDSIVYYQYTTQRTGRFNPNTRQVFGGPYCRYSADIIETEIFEKLDRELRLGGL